MANKHKGEFEIQAGDKLYRGKFGFNTYAKMEQAFGKPLQTVIADLDKAVSIQTVLTIIAIALRNFHPELTDEAVGDIIDEVGFDEIAKVMMKGIQGSMPQAKEGEAGAADHPTA